MRRSLNRSPLLKRTYFRLTGLYHRGRIKGANLSRGFNRDARTESMNPENVVWIFCTGRSGSTWLRSMIEELTECNCGLHCY